ncbi:segregation and condensation protein B [Streptococcus equinus]|uniref:SMC-Scp complex subunit ScpB n=1 Tax=Streptococcus equinus TaxID=1335 RepID=UPI00087132E9|nr:SMC-Scp complex subunit ScpB [Streptococcus equinus]MEE0949739.1 SMC-Scp complex subunit ScpB [Streptococcus equinus]SCW35327.1 segregation and condensation protein B [Streptococcus equinus]
MNYLAQIEALLFVAGEEGLSLRHLASMVNLTPTALQQQLEKLAKKYESDETSSLCLIETAGCYKIVTKETFADLLRDFAKAPVNQSLSRASLEVLSIIAYKQPITRIEVDDIRGVNSSSAISKLMALGLIREAGKKEVIGRPNLYATTDYFLDFMGINDLSELIDVSNIELVDEEMTLFDQADFSEEAAELAKNDEMV